ncbi:hypothetical protein C8R44DRAFT_762611, partial [Mycena epipterygia]
MLDSRASHARVLGAQDAGSVDPVCAGCNVSLTGLSARIEVGGNREGTGRDRQAARVKAGQNG